MRTPASCRPIAVGPLNVEIRTDDETAAHRIDRLFQGFPTASDGPRSLVVTVLLAEHGGASAGGPLYDSWLDGEPLASAAALPEHEVKITRVLNVRKLDAEPAFLHVHSAAVARGEEVMLLVGRSGAGKSTLTAALVRSGWDYVTDEMVTIRPGDGEVVAYPRPITLRKGVWDRFPELGPYPDTPLTENEGARVEVPPLDLGEIAPASGLHVVGVVWPVFREVGDEGPMAVPTPAEAVRRMSECCYDLERLGAAGVECLVRLAARQASWQLDYRDLGRAVEDFGALYRQARAAAPLAVTYLPPRAVDGNGPRAPGQALRRVADAYGWQLADGTAVLYRPPTLDLALIDADGVDTWKRLIDAQRLETLLEGLGDGPRAALERWLEMMQRAGFVELVA